MDPAVVGFHNSKVSKDRLFNVEANAQVDTLMITNNQSCTFTERHIGSVVDA